MVAGQVECGSEDTSPRYEAIAADLVVHAVPQHACGARTWPPEPLPHHHKVLPWVRLPIPLDKQPVVESHAALSRIYSPVVLDHKGPRVAMQAS